MSLGSWDPNAEQEPSTFSIERAVLDKYIELAKSDQLTQLETQLSEHEIQIQSALMQQDKAAWMQASEAYSDSEIIALMRFFTCAEELPGWHSGERSPVIWLGKVLKKRGTGISKELATWIKQHSNNRYLPHGPLL